MHDKTFYFKFGDRSSDPTRKQTFRVDAGMHVLVAIKKILGKTFEEIFTDDFNWADPETLRGTVAACLYRSLRRKIKARDAEEVSEYVGDLIDLEIEDGDHDAWLTETGETVVRVLVMSQYHMTLEELEEESNKVEEQLKALEKKADTTPPEKKRTKKKNGGKSKKTDSSYSESTQKESGN